MALDPSAATPAGLLRHPPLWSCLTTRNLHQTSSAAFDAQEEDNQPCLTYQDRLKLRHPGTGTSLLLSDDANSNCLVIPATAWWTSSPWLQTSSSTPVPTTDGLSRGGPLAPPADGLSPGGPPAPSTDGFPPGGPQPLLLTASLLAAPQPGSRVPADPHSPQLPEDTPRWQLPGASYSPAHQRSLLTASLLAALQHLLLTASLLAAPQCHLMKASTAPLTTQQWSPSRLKCFRLYH